MARRARRRVWKEPIAPCPYCGMRIWIGPGWRGECHTCDLFARWGP
jgi:hypothetical protein